MEYCFIAGNYPTKVRQVHIFLENVVTRLVDKGEKCNVIAPQSYIAYFFKKDNKRPTVAQYTTPNGNSYNVYSPLYFIFPKFKLGKLSFYMLNKRMIYKSILKTYKKNNCNADVVYSHFVQAGICGVKLAGELGIYSVIANGEADTIKSLENLEPSVIKETLENVSGIISVSTKNKNEISKLSNNNEGVMKKTKIIVNGADNKKFYKKDKNKIREKMGWKKDAFIVAFTGSFIERKGVLRLSNALNRFDDVYSIFMGVGEQKPSCKNILHCGRVNNAQLSDYLNGADVFVLPTQAEGCSNAIVEAIMCGLPVISSDSDFNYDILDEKCAILIDPNNEDEIYNAIKSIKDNKNLRDGLSKGAIKKAEKLSLDVRVNKIQEFIKEIMQ